MSNDLLIQFVHNHNRIELLYSWVQTGQINVDQLRDLIEVDKQENQRQIDLDSWD